MEPDNERDNQPDRGLERVIVAIVGAVVTFCLIAVVIYYRMAEVPANGWIHGGPVTMTAAMAGLFAGGFAAFVMLVLLLQRR
jgi:hypothetical protein